MKIVVQVVFYLFCAAVGLGISFGGTAFANHRNRRFVEVHHCAFMLSHRNESIVIFGVVHRVPDETFYQCTEPDVVVIVDGKPAIGSR